MLIETIGEAQVLGWRVAVRCSGGRAECTEIPIEPEVRLAKKSPDMETLAFTRGTGFAVVPAENSASRPHCGTRNVVVLYQPAGAPAAP